MAPATGSITLFLALLLAGSALHKGWPMNGSPSPPRGWRARARVPARCSC
jgi:hypothetical protein